MLHTIRRPVLGTHLLLYSFTSVASLALSFGPGSRLAWAQCDGIDVDKLLASDGAIVCAAGATSMLSGTAASASAVSSPIGSLNLTPEVCVALVICGVALLAGAWFLRHTYRIRTMKLVALMCIPFSGGLELHVEGHFSFRLPEAGWPVAVVVCCFLYSFWRLEELAMMLKAGSKGMSVKGTRRPIVVRALRMLLRQRER